MSPRRFFFSFQFLNCALRAHWAPVITMYGFPCRDGGFSWCVSEKRLGGLKKKKTVSLFTFTFNRLIDFYFFTQNEIPVMHLFSLFQCKMLVLHEKAVQEPARLQIKTGCERQLGFVYYYSCFPDRLLRHLTSCWSQLQAIPPSIYPSILPYSLTSLPPTHPDGPHARAQSREEQGACANCAAHICLLHKTTHHRAT